MRKRKGVRCAGEEKEKKKLLGGTLRRENIPVTSPLTPGTTPSPFRSPRSCPCSSVFNERESQPRLGCRVGGHSCGELGDRGPWLPAQSNLVN